MYLYKYDDVSAACGPHLCVNGKSFKIPLMFPGKILEVKYEEN